VIIDNRGGASGTLAAAAMAQEQRGDGYMVGQLPITVFRFPMMSSRPTWDPLRDFTYIIHLTGYLFGVVVKADSPWKNWEEFLAYAKANPGKVAYGSPGVGTTLHITMERIALERGIEFLHVPFRGGADNAQSLLSGQTQAMVDSTSWAPLVDGGQFRLLCTWGETRAKRYPDAPTLVESGINIVSTSPYGIAAPKGVDPSIVKVLHDGFKQAHQLISAWRRRWYHRLHPARKSSKASETWRCTAPSSSRKASVTRLFSQSISTVPKLMRG